MKMQEDGIEKMLAGRKPDTTPSHALEDYTGKFEHPAYGVLEIRVEDGVLKGVRNSMEFTYEHHHYDVFVGRSPEMEGAAFLTSFQTDVEGTISSAGIMLQPGVSDILFKRVTA
jgi:hypothetical protein